VELTEQDMLFIGPNDLALSVLGYVPARGDEPEFIDAIERIVGAAKKHNKWVGRLSNDRASCKKHLEVFDTVALSYDIGASFTAVLSLHGPKLVDDCFQAFQVRFAELRWPAVASYHRV
jgi:2-keto-3-deoxy-L-rhamnonate aldolase RhmA